MGEGSDISDSAVHGGDSDGGFHSHGGTPSHPFLDGIFHYHPAMGVPPFQESCSWENGGEWGDDGYPWIMGHFEILC